jgi:glutaredoxin 1
MIEIYGKPNCSMCIAAKQLLDSKAIPYEYKVLGEHFTREEIMEKAPGAKVFPQVFLDGVNIGSFNDLRHKIGLIEQTGMLGGPSVLLG